MDTCWMYVLNTIYLFAFNKCIFTYSMPVVNVCLDMRSLYELHAIFKFLWDTLWMLYLSAGWVALFFSLGTHWSRISRDGWYNDGYDVGDISLYINTFSLSHQELEVLTTFSRRLHLVCYTRSNDVSTWKLWRHTSNQLVIS